MDPGRLLVKSGAAEDNEFACLYDEEETGGALLGALLGEMALKGRDKVTFVFSPALAPFGDWVEQLIAESTGKEGKGILPVVDETLGPPGVYGRDRVFVSVRLGGDLTGERELLALAGAGHPVIDLTVTDLDDLGGLCFLWELATAVAGWRLAINPFDQPDVEAAKAIARKMIAWYREKGALPPETPALTAEGLAVFGAVTADSPVEALGTFLGLAGTGAYVGLQAYLRPCPETGAALQRLRMTLRDRFRLPATVGYGPRFLHSTGQLHKGDGGKGLFIQLTADDPRDAPIPDEAGRPASSLTFGILKAAQAFGDGQALVNAGRRVLRLHFAHDPAAGLARLERALRGNQG